MLYVIAVDAVEPRVLLIAMGTEVCVEDVITPLAPGEPFEVRLDVGAGSQWV